MRVAKYAYARVLQKGQSLNKQLQAFSQYGVSKTNIFVDEMARTVNMAPSTFYRHFKEVLGISPLQFHKQLRLYEAQRLMISEGINVSTAAYQVGYESTSQFSRDYKRLFGMSPNKDIQKRLVKALV